jgi:hypothetical protein
MARISNIERRYRAIESIARGHVELFAVHDPLGSEFNSAVLKLIRKVKQEGPGIWDGLAAAVRRLRYLLVAEPGPFELNPRLSEAVEQLHIRAAALSGATNDAELISELLDRADALVSGMSQAGTELVRSVLEVGSETCLVIAANARAKDALKPWLGEMGIGVFTLGELKHERITQEISYFVGPPRFFPGNSVTAPFTNEIVFIFPSWFSDRRIPTSVLAQISERAIQVEGRLFEIGVPGEFDSSTTEIELPDNIEDDLALQPNWGQRKSENREPKDDETEARKLLLSGGYAIWLDDDGDRIRVLDANMPVGDRVRFEEIRDVQPGTYLLLREGVSERDTLQDLAFKRLGKHAEPVKHSQISWKTALGRRILSLGIHRAESELRNLGLSAFGQLKSWTLPHTIRPQKDLDFEILLGWLNEDVQTRIELANRIRQETLRASHSLRAALESAAEDTDIHELTASGCINFDLDEPGYHGMFAARVVAIAPFTEIVSRSEIRLPWKDDGAQWLE